MGQPPTNPAEQLPANLMSLQQELAEIAATTNVKPAVTIRPCRQIDFDTIYTIMNDAAEAYRGVIPADCWKVPYMSREELRHEIGEGVVFSGAVSRTRNWSASWAFRTLPWPIGRHKRATRMHTAGRE